MADLLADVPFRRILAWQRDDARRSQEGTDTRLSVCPRFGAAISNRIVCTYRVSSTVVLITGKIRKRKVSGTFRGVPDESLDPIRSIDRSLIMSFVMGVLYSCHPRGTDAKHVKREATGRLVSAGTRRR